MAALGMHKNEPFCSLSGVLTSFKEASAIAFTLSSSPPHSCSSQTPLSLNTYPIQAISTSRIVQPKHQLCFHRSSPGLVDSRGGARWYTRGYQRKCSSNSSPSFGSTTCKVKTWTARQSLRLFLFFIKKKSCCAA